MYSTASVEGILERHILGGADIHVKDVGSTAGPSCPTSKKNQLLNEYELK